MKILKNLLHDILKSGVIGIIAALVLAVLASLVSLIRSGIDLESLLSSIRTTLFIAGSLGILIGAGLRLKYRKGDEKLEYIERYKESFYIIDYKTVVIFVAVFIILVGSIAEIIMMNLYPTVY